MGAGTPRIAVSSPSGDPMSPATWSGTPFHIIRALQDEGCDVVPIDSSIRPRVLRAAHRVLHLASGLGHHYLRGTAGHAHMARNLVVAARRARCQRVLHTSSFDVPLRRQDDGLRHDLFCDSTWSLWSRDATDMDEYPPRARAMAESVARRAYDTVEHFYPIAHYLADHFADAYAIPRERITVVGTGRGSIEPMAGVRDDSACEILFAGKVRFEDKGGPLLIDAFRIAQRANPKLRLTLVAEERYRPLLDGIPGATLTGFLPWDELQRLFNRANLFAMPAINEPWGLVYLEALACATPILGLNRNAVPELSGNGRYGFLVDRATPEAVAEALLDAFSDSARLRRMGDAGQAHCLSTYSWRNVARAILSHE